MSNVVEDKFYLNRARDEKGRIVSKMARKKICPCCGRLLWKKKDFYVGPNGNISSYCKECQRKKSNRQYVKKQPDGIRLDKNGVLKEYVNGRARTYWSETMLKWLKDNFATTTNADLASEIGVSESVMKRKAHSLGLKKDKEFMLKTAAHNARLGGAAMKMKYGKTKKRAYLSQAGSSQCK